MIASRDDEAALRPGVFDGGGAIVFNMLRPAAICVAALILCAGPAQADYKAGRAAWDAGRHGEAVAQWRAAARAQDVRAMLALGRAFAKGVGVPQDFIEAHKWLNLAAGRGSAEGAAERDALAKEMTAGERAEARRLARAWRIAAPRPETKPKPAAPAGKAERPKKPAPAAPPPPRALREAQGLLARLGYGPGPADGVWRPESAQAYRAFLGKAGMAPGDVLTPAGLRALRRAAKGRAAAARTAGQGLHRAVQAGDIDGLKAALEAGANANARDRRGWTALMHAANKGQTLMVAPLLAAKADPDVRAADGATALFMAAAHGHTEIVVQLMKAGADISLKGPKGRTAADVARLRYGKPAVARRKGADLAILALLAGKTWAAVSSSPEAMEAALALTARERRLIQAGLAALGFRPGPADGVFGPATRAAIRAWQKKNGRAATGRLTAADEMAFRAQAAKRKAEREREARARAARAKSEQARSPKCAGMTKGAECWIELANKPGCFFFYPHYSPGVSWTWSGACAGGFAAGRGTQVRTLNGKSAKFTGALVRGKRLGRWVVRWADGTVNEGSYVNGKEHGRWVVRSASGYVSEGSYVDGKPHGRWVFRQANGHVSEGSYADGKKHGRWVERHTNGNVAEGPFVNGERHGRWVFRFAAGRCLVGRFFRGRQIGSYRKC